MQRQCPYKPWLTATWPTTGLLIILWGLSTCALIWGEKKHVLMIFWYVNGCVYPSSTSLPLHVQSCWQPSIHCLYSLITPYRGLENKVCPSISKRKQIQSAISRELVLIRVHPHETCTDNSICPCVIWVSVSCKPLFQTCLLKGALWTNQLVLKTKLLKA